MDDFPESVIYEGDLPRPHSELEEFVGEDRPSSDRSLFADLAIKYGSHVAGGMSLGFGLAEGLEQLGMLEAMGASDQMTLLLGPPLAGATVGSYLSFNKYQDELEEKNKWRKAQDLERTVQDFSWDLEDHDFVVVRDYLLGEGEPIERTGEAASALYNEVSGLEDVQYVQEDPRGFPEVDYQLSLFEDGEPLRTFYVGEDLVEEVEGSYPEAAGDSFVEENMDSAVSLEEYR